MLSLLGQLEAAIAVYDEVERRFDLTPESGRLDQVGWARFNKAAALAALGHTEAARAIYYDIEHRVGSDDRPSTREAVERASAQRKRLAEGQNNG